ncbi:YtfJ family protein, partial [Klebsiella pneumoniae]|uniref:YtfJ family protein n=1 Tax=Klebsiella pneumoniae TaxID=573 RepID=UPI00396A0EEF
ADGQQRRDEGGGQRLCSAIVVLDKNGHVQWAKDGALTQQEVQQVIDLLHKLLNK